MAFAHTTVAGAARRTSPQYGFLTSDAFVALGIPLPRALVTIREKAVAIERRLRGADGAKATAEAAVLDALAVDPDADVARLVAVAQVVEATGAAVEIAANRIYHEHRQLLARHADDVIEAAQPIAAELLDVIGKAAALSTIDLAELARRDDTDAVLVIGAATRAWVRLEKLRAARKSLALVVSQQHQPCAEYRDPSRLPRDLAPGVDGVIAAIRAGAEPWFPTFAQAREQVERLHGDPDTEGATAPPGALLM